MTLGITFSGGPTALLELGGVRLLTDPTFDAPGDHPVGERVLVKTEDSVLSEDAVGVVDAVLLSHDQHPDNLDDRGRAYLATVPLTLITPAGAARLGGTAKGLAPWEETRVGPLTVTAVPALHGPEGASRLTGDVTGFILTGDGLPTVYVSGDNASVDLVREIAARFRVDVAVLFAGAARTVFFDGAPLTLTSENAVEAAKVLDAAKIVPLHFRGWQHFSEGPDVLRKEFEAAGLADRLVLLEPGQHADV
ncbi:L-ascorbate metabolism protein UlaG (beta-lactamase superfamily) [Amycolatopsis lexingtonensis]|uniref:L-ascorbate metabolism protein UlaG (Beta-lactamase superfamily) n=1 Tax=Amycolatopsis lexingtonensis TaxID=218822 RepID=A0ABR9I3F0_9PSEU|nr:MBL fold metallo-hydrolase [Amycolatopsis lexingtonensis]MBE1497643.1 L-ascorbate metabolism protein UlaG (beta-lactamase superfamily) [Amycolatopsis lexingtonensis]